MNIDAVARNIQIILAPVVMVTACAILLQGLLGRYAAINERLRALAAERIMLVFKDLESSDFRTERLRLIDTQVPTLVNHHKRAHDSAPVNLRGDAYFHCGHVRDCFRRSVRVKPARRHGAPGFPRRDRDHDAGCHLYFSGDTDIAPGCPLRGHQRNEFPEQNPPRTGPDVPGMDDKLKLPIEG